MNKFKPLVELKNVNLIYHSTKTETTALQNINLDIQKQEFVSIVGPSGCGKTTILSIISGLLKITDGSVLVAGNKPSTKSNICGYMFQRDNLLPWRTIENNLFLGLEIKHQKSKVRKNYAISLANKYGIGEFLKKHPSELSGGMRQRVALIRTLALKPELLLLDEPFSALDYQTRLELCDSIFSIIKQEKKTAILVTHDIQEAISMSDRIIVLSARPGKIKAVHKLNFSPDLTPFERRKTEESKILFDTIWQEIQNETHNI
ncbi:MAG: ABC transporter ATP-binding protein [Clostridia bacterium]|nr:ABC transporter ATP-binding protein [Clostridia bacterium]